MAELVNLLKIKIMKKAILALVVGLISMALAWYWFSWKLVVVIFLALFGNNLQRSSQEK